MPSLRHGPSGIVRQIGRDFETDEAIFSIGSVIHRPQDVTGVPNVADHQPLIDLMNFTPRMHELLKLRVIVIAARNGFVENGGVGGDSAQSL